MNAPHSNGKTAERFVLMVVILLVLLVWGLILNVNTGSVKIPAGDVLKMVWDAVRFKILNLFEGNYQEELA